MRQVIDEFIFAAKQTPRLFFAPFIGAWKEVRRVSHEMEALSRRRSQAPDKRTA